MINTMAFPQAVIILLFDLFLVCAGGTKIGWWRWAPVREMYINEYGERRALLSLTEGPLDEGATDATAEILIINSIPFVTRSIYFGAQRSLASALGSARF